MSLAMILSHFYKVTTEAFYLLPNSRTETQAAPQVNPHDQRLAAFLSWDQFFSVCISFAHY